MTKHALPEIDLTIKKINELPTPVVRKEYKDRAFGALRLRVTPKGVKTFSYFGRAKGGDRPERITYGKFPSAKPDEARNWARQLAGQLAAGVSVAASDRARRGELTLAELYEAYKAHLVHATKRVDLVESSWSLYIEPHFAKRRLSTITGVDLGRWHAALPGEILRRRAELAAARAEAREARRKIAEASRAARKRGPDPKPREPKGVAPPSPVSGQRAANLAMQNVRAMFNWAIKLKPPLFAGPNPARDQHSYDDNSRDRFLQGEELAPFFKALAEEANVTMRDFFLLALLTAARRSNVAGAQWKHINLDRAEWRVPKALMKNKKAQVITLSPEAVEILRNRAIGTTSPFVFPSELSKTGHMVAPSAAWRRLLSRAGLADVRIHDLRRTLGSWQAKTGASLVMIGKSLNHSDYKSTAVYAHLDLDPVRQSVDRAVSAIFVAGNVKKSADVAAIRAAVPGQHPGRALRAEIERLGATTQTLSRASGIPTRSLNEICAGDRDISAETSIRLGRALGADSTFWLCMQAAYDVAGIEREIGDQIARDVRPIAAEA